MTDIKVYLSSRGENTVVEYEGKSIRNKDIVMRVQDLIKHAKEILLTYGESENEY